MKIKQLKYLIAMHQKFIGDIIVAIEQNEYSEESLHKRENAKYWLQGKLTAYKVSLALVRKRLSELNGALLELKESRQKLK